MSSACALRPSRWTLTKGTKTETVGVRPKLLANSSLALHRALLEGLGLARIPWFVVGDDLASGRLVQNPPPPQSPHPGRKPRKPVR